MFTKLASYAGALLILQGVTACSADNDPVGQAATEAAASPRAAERAASAAPIEDTRLVVAFGDSLYAGYGVEPQESLPAKLETVLAARGVPAKVTNAGVSGDTTAAARRRLDFTLDGLERKPDLVMISLGGNDMLRGIDPDQTRENLTAICEELQRRGIPILFTGMIAAPNMGRDYAERFNAIYPDLARRYDAALYPFILDGVVTNPRLMQNDRVHPTAAGIDVIVGRLAPLVAGALDKQ